MSNETPTPASPAGVRSVALQFLRDDDGAVFLEFLIVLYAWMLLLFGVIQVGLIAIASFYVNYANFMALRTASVHYDFIQYDWLTENDLKSKCETAAVKALAPLERYYWVNESKGFSIFGDSFSKAKNRTTFHMRKVDDNTLEGQLEYDFILIVPFVNRVIAGFAHNVAVPDENRVMKNVGLYNRADRKLPRLTMRSYNDLGANAYHQMVIQRRWRYN